MSFAGTKLLGIDFAVTDTTAAHALGSEVMAYNGTVYRYVKAAAAIAAGDALKMDTANADEPNALTPTAAVNEVVEAIAPVAIASASYGWVVVRGKVASAKLATSTAAGAQLGTSATAGTLSTVTISATPTQAEIQRVLAAASGKAVIAVDAEATGTGEVFIH